MPSSFALLVVVLAPLQTGETDPGPFAVKVVRGQEFVFRGTVRDEVSTAGSVTRRAYDFETNCFILEARGGTVEVAFQTILRPNGSDKLGSVRLEMASVSSAGKLTTPNGSASRPPVDAPPTLEPAGFVPLAAGPHPVEAIRGVRCVKLVRTVTVAGGTRHETAWVAVQNGIVRKMERTFERFTGGEQTSSHRLVVAYELASEVVVPDALSTGRRREIAQAAQTQQRLVELRAKAGKVGPAAFDGLLLRLADHIESQPATPYRPAVLWVQTRVEAGKRGDVPAPARLP